MSFGIIENKFGMDDLSSLKKELSEHYRQLEQHEFLQKLRDCTYDPNSFKTFVKHWLHAQQRLNMVFPVAYVNNHQFLLYQPELEKLLRDAIMQELAEHGTEDLPWAKAPEGYPTFENITGGMFEKLGFDFNDVKNTEPMKEILDWTNQCYEVVTFGTLGEIFSTLLTDESWAPYFCAAMADYADEKFGSGAGIFFKYHEIADQGHGGSAARGIEILIEEGWIYERPLLGIKGAAYRQLMLWESMMGAAVKKLEAGQFTVPDYLV